MKIMKITDVLTAEHAAFARLFDLVERALVACRTVGEVRMLAGLVEGLLHHHGAAEEHLVYSVLDHVLEEKGDLNRMHQDHKEIDMQLHQLATDPDLARARQRLKAALAACREHFRSEEDGVFPLIHRVLRSETLTELGETYLRQNSVARHSAARSLSDAA